MSDNKISAVEMLKQHQMRRWTEVMEKFADQMSRVYVIETRNGYRVVEIDPLEYWTNQRLSSHEYRLTCDFCPNESPENVIFHTYDDVVGGGHLYLCRCCAENAGMECPIVE